MAWTEERLSELQRLLAQEKMSASQAAHKMGVTRNAVIGAAHRNGLEFARELGCHSLTRAPRKMPSRPKAIVTRARLSPPKSKIDLSTLRAVPVAPLNITFDQLDWGDCRYPVTDNPPHLFCGHPKLTTSSYCLEHHFLCMGGRRDTPEENSIRKRSYRRQQVSKVLEAAE